jgi:hypothetical protein
VRSTRDGNLDSVLVVEADAELRARMASWLEDAGFVVMSCPGPSAPDYDCVGVRRGECPLAKGADLVVLDVWTDADRAYAGPGGRRLFHFYTRLGVPVLVVHPGRAAESYSDEFLADIDWPPDRRELLENAQSLQRLSRSR